MILQDIINYCDCLARALGLYFATTLVLQSFCYKLKEFEVLYINQMMMYCV